MSWLNHFLDYETLEGFSGLTGVTSFTIPQEGETGETGTAEPYNEFFKNIYYLIIYFGIFLLCFFLGGPFMFYFYVLIKAQYFPVSNAYLRAGAAINMTQAQKNDLQKIQNVIQQDNSFQSDILKTSFVDENGDEQEVTIPLILNTKGYNAWFLRRPEYPDQNGNVDGSQQHRMYRWFYKVMSMASLWYFNLSKIVVLIGIKPLVILIMFVLYISFIGIIRANVNNMPNFNNFYSLLIFVSGSGLISFIYIILVVASYCSLGELLTSYSGGDANQVQYDQSNYTMAAPPSWNGGLWFIVYCIIIVFTIIVIALYAVFAAAIFTIVLVGSIIQIMFDDTGCYIFDGKMKPLGFLGIFHLFFIYCTLFVNYFYELILFFFVSIALTINRKLGLWVAIVTIISWAINWKKFVNFKNNYLSEVGKNSYAYMKNHSQPSIEKFSETKGCSPDPTNPGTITTNVDIKEVNNTIDSTRTFNINKPRNFADPNNIFGTKPLFGAPKPNGITTNIKKTINDASASGDAYQVEGAINSAI